MKLALKISNIFFLLLFFIHYSASAQCAGTINISKQITSGGCNPVCCGTVCVDFTLSGLPNCAYSPTIYFHYGDGASYNGTGAISHCYNTAGTYTATVSVSCINYSHVLCAYDGSTIIKVNPAPNFTATVSSDTLYCPELRSVIVASGASNYTWTGLTANDTLRNDSAFVHRSEEHTSELQSQR